LWLLLLVATVAAAPTALADGDPASDYLLTQSTFVSPNARISSSDKGRLDALLGNARQHGYTIRVAVIQSRYDLGAVTALDNKPRLYARFLSQELRFVYRKRLLVVMPNGYGIARDGKTASTEQRILDGVTPAGTTDGSALVAAAISAVDALLTHASVPVTVSRSNGDTISSAGVLIVAAVALLGLMAGGLTLTRRRRSVPLIDDGRCRPS
jgi:hypothetical protein